MIAVLLLVASIGIIGALEQRSDPVINQDADLVMDRSETAAQSELRSAAVDASHKAVSAPIIDASGSDIDAISVSNDQDENFKNYLKLLIYLEAHDRLSSAGQNVNTDVKSTVSIPKVSKNGGKGLSPDEAIDEVELTIGDDPTTDLEPGLLEVTIQNVEIDAEVDGKDLPSETRAVTVTVGSPVMQLNERTTEYEDRLNQGFFEEADDGLDTELEGLGQHMAARLYPFAYFKSGWDRMHSTRSPDDHDFERVLEPNHTEVLANHAIFSIQEDVFGTQDPYAERTLRPGYICMAYQIGDSMSGGGNDDDTADIVDGDEFGMKNDSDEVEDKGIDIEEQLCDGGEVQKWLFGDKATGELPDMPELSTLIQDGLGEMEVMNEEEEIPIAEAAEVSYLYYDAAGHLDEAKMFADRTNDAIDKVENTYRDDVEETIDDDEDPPEIDDSSRTIRSMTEELYDVDVERDVSTSSSGSLPSPTAPSPSYNYTNTKFDVEIADVLEVNANHDEYPNPTDRTIHEMDARALVEVEADEKWVHDDPSNASAYGEQRKVTRSPTENVTVELDLEIEAEYDFYEEGLYKDDFPIQNDPDINYDYRYLPTTSVDVENKFNTIKNESEVAPPKKDPGIEIEIGKSTNFFAPFVDSAVGVPDGFTYYGSIEDTLETNGAGIGGDVDSTSDIEDKFEDALITDDSDYQESYDLGDMKSMSEEEKILDDLNEELNQTHNEFTDWIEDENNTYTIERTEMLDSDAKPISGAIDHIEAVEDDFVYRNLSADGPGDTFETPGELLTAQVRKAYFDRMYHYIESIADQYENRVEDVEEEIDDMGGPATDAGDEVLGFAQDVLNADIERSYEEIEGSPVLDDAQYEVAGSPTYLTHENISEDQDPAVRPEDATITDFDAETEHVPLTIQSNNRAPWPGVPVTPVPPSFWLLQINSWEKTIKGEYARFEVSATIGDPADADRLTYVREHRPIEVELHDGETVELGSNEPIDFESTTEVVVAMPGGVVSTGSIPSVGDTDPKINGQTACSPTWEHIGPDFDPDVDTNMDECDFPDD
ncbi:DUF7286 family protein [Halopiger djelfimassiliensis]